MHDFEPTHFHVTIGSHDPVLGVASGDTIRTWCVDAAGFDRSREKLTEGPNPQTGPFFVEGAESGDTLLVRFNRIHPNRDRGVSGQVVAPHVVDPDFVPRLGHEEREPVWWQLDHERATARLEAPSAELASLGELPLAPIVGCFGVAPPDGMAISTATSWVHGGNMDYRGFREGVASPCSSRARCST